jgi:hypothetical protein
MLYFVEPMQKDRGEILRALLAAKGGQAKAKMHMSRSHFSELLASMRRDIATSALQL